MATTAGAVTGQDTPQPTLPRPAAGSPSDVESQMTNLASLMSAPTVAAAPVDDVLLAPGEELVPLPWQEQALCAQTDPEAFFPEKGGSTREAKRVCSRCDVRGDCLTYALAHDERFGIWGGLSERERRRLKRQAV